MRPQYVNGFSIAKNENVSEVIICFKQAYVDGKGNANEEDITSVVLSTGGAMELQKALNQIIGDTYDI